MECWAFQYFRNMEEEHELDLQSIARPLYEARGWMKLLGVVMIILGALMVLTVYGIILAWLPIWLGVLLFQAAGKATGAYVGNDEVLLVDALTRVRRFFVINGVLMLICLVLIVLGMFFGLLAIATF